MPTPAAILAAIAGDPVAGQLNMRDLQVISLICHERADPSRCTTAAIGHSLGLTANAMTRVGHRLVERALAVRTGDPRHQRRVVLAPTAAGLALDQRVRAMFEDDGERRENAA